MQKINKSPRKALILAAGLGTRLRPLTDNMPKALVPVAGKPMLEHLILKLKTKGFTKIVINVHHLADMIIDFLINNKNFDIDIFISDERDRLLDTGGGIKQAARFLQGEEPFLVHNVDIISDVDLDEMYEKHVDNDAFATLLVSDRQSSRRLFFNTQGHLCGRENKSSGEYRWSNPKFLYEECHGYAFAGIHVISSRIFDCFDGWNGKFSIIDYYLSMAQTQNICSYIPRDIKVIDIGKEEALMRVEYPDRTQRVCSAK